MINAVGGNWSHISNRGVRGNDKVAMDKCLKGILMRIKERRMPNCSWYKPVFSQLRLVGYICGQGCYVSTFLSADMKPKGVKI
jgi:hypothetical protein